MIGVTLYINDTAGFGADQHATADAAITTGGFYGLHWVLQLLPNYHARVVPCEQKALDSVTCQSPAITRTKITPDFGAVMKQTALIWCRRPWRARPQRPGQARDSASLCTISVDNNVESDGINRQRRAITATCRVCLFIGRWMNQAG
jgi:hypothetical protein